MKKIRAFLSVSLSLILTFLAPGVPCYAALGQASNASSAAKGGAQAAAIRIEPQALAELDMPGLDVTAPDAALADPARSADAALPRAETADKAPQAVPGSNAAPAAPEAASADAPGGSALDDKVLLRHDGGSSPGRKRPGFLHRFVAPIAATLLAATVAIVGVTHGQTPDVQPPAAGGSAERVLVISLDGAQPSRIKGLIDQGKLEAFKEFSGRGTGVQEAQPPFPSLTPVSHASISSGAWPAKTGVLSTSFHEVKKVITQTTNGFAVPIPVETLMSSARKQNKTVASIGWPHVSPELGVELGMGWTVAFGTQASAPVSVSKKQGDWKEAGKDWTLGNLVFDPKTPPQASTFDIQLLKKGPKLTFHLLVAADKDGKYDKLYITRDTDITQGVLGELGVGGWVMIPTHENGVGGSYAKLIAMSPDLRKFQLYVGASHLTRAGPVKFRDEIVSKFGPFPGSADHSAMERGNMDEETFLEQEKRLDEWLFKIGRHVWDTYTPDLMMLYQPGTDSIAHQFNMQNKTQFGYTVGRARRYQSYIERTYIGADKRLAPLLASAKDANVFIVSDHGMAPLHTIVSVKGLLKENHFKVEGSRKEEVRAVGSGGFVHVYINLEGREEGGVVPKADYSQLQDRLVKVLSEYEDPRTNEKVFQIVRKKGDLDKIGLEHPNAGDVVAVARPGYYMAGTLSSLGVLTPSKYYGQHGYDSTLPEMQATFMAAGPGIKASKTEIKGIRLIDVAPTAAASMGIQGPKEADGVILQDILVRPAPPKPLPKKQAPAVGQRRQEREGQRRWQVQDALMDRRRSALLDRAARGRRALPR